MATNKVRTTAPKSGNKYYNTKSNGGYSSCIIGNYPYGASKSKRTGIVGLNTLPNCVGYAVGAFNEQGNYKTIKYDLNTDAKNFIDLSKKLGLNTGSVPKLGGIMVWANGSYGHVAIVSEKKSDTEVVVTESGWSYRGKTGVWSASHQKGKDGNLIEGGVYIWMSGRYKYIGCVYSPDIEDVETTVLDVDGVWGKETTIYTQKRMSTTQDGIVSGQNIDNKKYLPACSTSSWEFKDKNISGSVMIKSLQNFLMMPVKNCNGICDQSTIKKFQTWLKRKQYYTGAVNGILNTETVKAWQNYLNNYFKNNGK